MKDMSNNIKVVSALAAAVYGSADVNGSAVDRQGFESVTFAMSVGAEGDTLTGSLYIQVEMEHSDDNSTWTDCAAADIIVPKDQTVVVDGTNSIVFKADDGAEAPVVFKVGYKGGKRYSRLVYNKEGTHSNGTPAAALAILGHASMLPVAA